MNQRSRVDVRRMKKLLALLTSQERAVVFLALDLALLLVGVLALYWVSP